MLNIIDTHSHLNFHAFKEDGDLVMKKTLANGIWMINVGTKYETSKKAVEIADASGEGVYSAIGLHPMFAGAEFLKIRTDPDEGEFLLKEQDFDKEKYRELAQSKKVVAIGEIGLDYYYKPKGVEKLKQFKEKQKQVFIQQLDLARELNLPVILHCRMAHDDVIQILSDYSLPPTNYKLRGVVHCFTGTLEQAQKYIAMGFYLGINGIIFKFNIDEVIKSCGLESLVVETDCPYLTPTPEGDKRNEPIFIKHTLQKIADLKGVTFDQVCEKTTQNARKLFGI
ncbi:MAG: TatD family deoxyribonuclease [Candidatus Staskawiczbacteria bacterium]|nr:TatD family deoxyribonuclease [Candidatus Staskawiczbacteria bacterium]